MTVEDQFSLAVEAFRRGELELALNYAEQAVAVSPTPSWHHLLGLTYCRRGRPDLGVEPLRLAAEAEPANATFTVMLARALIDSGTPEAVLRMPKPPLSPTPAQLGLWHARAEAAAAIADHAEAVEAWLAITECGQANAEAWVSLGRSLLVLNRFAEAEAAYERALAMCPRDIPALSELGLVYQRINRLEKLGQLLDEARQAGVSDDELGFLWAIREQRSGNLAAARGHLLKSDPSHDPVSWQRLRSKIADQEGDASTAFAASLAMNRATPAFEEWRKRAHAYRRELRSLAEVMTGEWATLQLQPGPGDCRAPAFLVGFPRSGTTLLDTFLMGHPAVVVIEEREILRRAGEIIGPLNRLPEASTAILDRARQSYLAEIAGYVDPDFAGIVIDKHPLNMAAAPLIQVLFPGSAIIFAQRHPCDAVLSGFMQSFVPNLGMASFLDLRDAADLYDAAMSVWSRAREVLPLHVRTVVYEELVGDPEPQLRSIIEFLGLEWDDRVMDHRATAKARGPILNTSYDQVTEELNCAAIGRWRRYEEQLQPVLPTLLPWAERLGYQG